MEHAVGGGRKALAIVGSLIFPGVGHLVLSRWRRAALWAGLYLVAVVGLSLIAATAAGRPAAWALFGGAVVAGIGLRLATIVGVAVIRRAPTPGIQWGGLAAGVVAIAVTALAERAAIQALVVEAYRVPSGAMTPAIRSGDHVVVSKLAYRGRTPARGDVVVLPHPREPRQMFAKRVIAVAGDTIEGRADGTLVLNGAPVPRARRDGCAYDDFDETRGTFERRDCVAFDETLDGRSYGVLFGRDELARAFAAVRVPPGHVFVVGDNRDNSFDSRFLGPMPADSVAGRITTVYLARGPQGLDTSRIGVEIR